MAEYWNTLSADLKNRYGKRLYKVSLNTGLSCPNRDGTIDHRGCIFCDGQGSGDFALAFDGQKLTKQDLIYNHQDGEEGQYIAYFQAFTNTYAPVDQLRHLFVSALENPLFAGISIATRPDCLGDDVLSLLQELKQSYPDHFIWVELGLQTIHDETARWMRRGYATAVFDESVRKLHEIGVEIIVHVIVGLPDETEEMLKQTIHHINALPIQGVKLQLLHYLSDTDLGQDYIRDPQKYHILTIEEYIDLIVMCIGNLRDDIVVHRLSGDGNGEHLLAPQWSRDKRYVINQIRHLCKIKDIHQGSLL